MVKTGDKVEWVEIIQPKTRQLIYANLKTGECTWDQPENCLNVRRINDQTHQWWELFDVKSSRFYYYNVNTSETKWQKPKEEGVIIIPLAKLQILKQDTLISNNSTNKRDTATQTNNSFTYCSNASTQTTPPSVHRYSSHHHTFHSRHCPSGHVHNHPSISERSLRHYLLNEARFAGLCYNIDDNYWDGSDEDEYDGEYEGSSEESSTDNWDADDEDNNEGEEDEFEDETDEEDEDAPSLQLRDRDRDETDTSDYYETSSFVYYKKSASFTSGLGSADNERPIKFQEEGRTLDIRRSERKTKDKSTEARVAEYVKDHHDPGREEEIKARRKERKESKPDEKQQQKNETDSEAKPVPPRRGISLDSSVTQPHSNEQLEKYARENIKRHLKKGGLNQMLKRRHSLKGMLIWTKFSIKQPMIATLMNDNDLKQEAINCFKLIQQYCGDRGGGKSSSSSSSLGKTAGAGPGAGTLVRREQVAKELITKGVVKGLLLRDEIFVQLCRQTTDNPLEESLQLGLELIALCLYYFGPSQKFAPYLTSFLSGHKSEFARKVCLKKLEIKMESSAGSGNSVGGHCRRPASVQEIAMVIHSIKRGFLGMFGESLNNLMASQSNYLPKRKLPWIQVTLSETILRLGGAEQEGIFRIAGDVEETTMLKLYIDCLEMDRESDTDFIVLCNKWKGISGNDGGRQDDDDEINLDVNVFACLLKQWFRELKEPVIPYAFYMEALATCESPSNAVYLIEKKLPTINKLVIGYLIRFLQVFSAKQNVDMTKMDENNLSMVWAPNILRAPPPNLTNTISNISNSPPNPSLIFENTRKEMTFIRTLIQYLDTSYIQGVI